MPRARILSSIVFALPLALGAADADALRHRVDPVASIAVALPDISYFINLFMFLLMCVSPIAFEPAMVPRGAALRGVSQPGLSTCSRCIVTACSPAGVDPRVWAIQAVLSLVALRARRRLLPRLQERAGRLRIMCGIAGVLAFDRGDTRVDR